MKNCKAKKAASLLGNGQAVDKVASEFYLMPHFYWVDGLFTFCIESVIKQNVVCCSTLRSA